MKNFEINMTNYVLKVSRTESLKDTEKSHLTKGLPFNF